MGDTRHRAVRAEPRSADATKYNSSSTQTSSGRRSRADRRPRRLCEAQGPARVPGARVDPRRRRRVAAQVRPDEADGRGSSAALRGAREDWAEVALLLFRGTRAHIVAWRPMQGDRDRRYEREGQRETGLCRLRAPAPRSARPTRRAGRRLVGRPLRRPRRCPSRRWAPTASRRRPTSRRPSPRRRPRARRRRGGGRAWRRSRRSGRSPCRRGG